MSDLNSLVSMIAPFAIVIVVFWFFIIRPQSQEQKRRKQMLEAVRKGDEVVTVGGIHGSVMVVKGDSLIVKIADKVEVEIDRSGIGNVRGRT